ncbi:GNAT family N-acetyltransferase [Bacillus sp. AK128]
MYELEPSEYRLVNQAFPYIGDKPVIQGVIEGNNRGRVYVDSRVNSPKAALIWAKNEMFYFVGVPTLQFVETIEGFLQEQVFPEALMIGDDHFNLEMYPFNQWDPYISTIFKKNPIHKAQRVPFTFGEEKFYQYLEYSDIQSVTEYQFSTITKEQILDDSTGVINAEIEKFWPSWDDFCHKGLGVSVKKGKEVVGTCISAFTYEKHYEIGINTYSTAHRGKGIVTEMAERFIEECLNKGYTPHWTTESFRKDSIRIAEKLGFTKHTYYDVYHFPIKG